MSYSEVTKRAVEKGGGPTVLAKQLGISKQAVANWEDVPAKHVHKVSSITGIPVEQIRPDLMPPQQAAE